MALTVLWLGLKMSLGEYDIIRNLSQRGLKRKTGISKTKYGVPGIDAEQELRIARRRIKEVQNG